MSISLQDTSTSTNSPSAFVNSHIEYQEDVTPKASVSPKETTLTSSDSAEFFSVVSADILKFNPVEHTHSAK